MKKLVSVVDVDGEGLNAFLGESIQVWCLNYIYAGTLTGVNETCIRLDDAKVVYETGPLIAEKFTDAEPLKGPAYIQVTAIEMFTSGK